VSDKSSRIVNLVILGVFGTAIALPLLPQGEEMRRNVYRSKDDCLSDYSEPECEPTNQGNSSGGSSYWYRGPQYRADPTGNPGDPGPGRYNGANSLRSPGIANTETSYRGGFGNISRRFGIGS
jgi:hypothetical protein